MAAALPVGQWRHVAVTRNGNAAQRYTNGVLAAAGAVTIAPANFNPALNYLGDSQYEPDPLFNGRLDEFFIYNVALSSADIVQLMSNRPPSVPISTAPVNVSMLLSGGVLGLLWPGDHTGWRLEAQTNSLTSSNWFAVPGSAATNQFFIQLDASLTSVFYRLTYP